MDGVDRVIRRKTLAERLGLKNIGCCGSTWALRPTTVSERDDDEEEYGPLEPQIEVITVNHAPPQIESTPDCISHSPAASGMNLAAALAAERHLRAALDSDNGGIDPGPSPSPARSSNNEWYDVTAGTAPRTPFRVSLMRLLEETDYCDKEVKKEERGAAGGGSGDSVCCVCMGRKKGAAFIPCGHTFCRVCSRELWLNRGNCPLCNRLILEILDIY
ncbi:death-associated inhibitor of apoptosis 1-like isoform X2 [Olea europaea var. sylvestris]|nr:death-associated inhibitor of apoptosis 1-like isoform X2 [Olea europaea var. sylvestris]XP_022892273.1 death-associated inhibitor of apoptosis 1-like isoform X2 [Olea europaea var. sylvestris]